MSTPDTVAAETTARARQILEQAGIRPTSQRVQMAEILLTSPRHLTAEQILAALRESAGHVSKATVYNTLNLFVAKNLIREVIVDPTRVFYDPNTSGHYHIYDVETGELTDIDAAEVRIEGLPALPNGMVVQGMDIIIRVRRAAKG
jgi:Fur family iron response transcriptional regulator